MISSVPYVPPDTMKKVAATRGQSVNFTTLFLVMETSREGNCAGTDIELNFTLVLLRETRSRRCGKASSHVQNTGVTSACKRKMHLLREFSPASLSVPSCLLDRLRAVTLATPDFLEQGAHLWSKTPAVLQAAISRPHFLA